MPKKIIKELKNILQSLCTHSAFSFFDNPIFVINRGYRLVEEYWEGLKRKSVPEVPEFEIGDSLG